MVMAKTEELASEKMEETVIPGTAPADEEPSVPSDTRKVIAEDESAKAERESTKTKESEAIVEKLDPKLQARVKVEVDRETDKRTKSYQEKRESDTLLIRKLTEDIKELKKQTSGKAFDNQLKKLLTGYEEEGLPEDQKDTFTEQVKAINQKVQEYNEKSAQVTETAQFIETMSAQMPVKIVKDFGLDDPNPNIRALNGIKLLDETTAVYRYNQNFLMAVEHFLPKGDELRKQLDALVDGMAEFEDNDNAKKLYIVDQLRGMKLTPSKKLPVPSGTPGGKDWRSATAKEKVVEQIRRDGNTVKVGGK